MHKFAFEGAPLGWCKKPHTNQALSYKLIHLLCQREKLHCLKTICLHTAFSILSLVSLFPRDLQADYSTTCFRPLLEWGAASSEPAHTASLTTCDSTRHWKNSVLSDFHPLSSLTTLHPALPTHLERPYWCNPWAPRYSPSLQAPPPGPPRPLASDSPPDLVCQSIWAPPWGAESWRQ